MYSTRPEFASLFSASYLGLLVWLLSWTLCWCLVLNRCLSSFFEVETKMILDDIQHQDWIIPSWNYCIHFEFLSLEWLLGVDGGSLLQTPLHCHVCILVSCFNPWAQGHVGNFIPSHILWGIYFKLQCTMLRFPITRGKGVWQLHYKNTYCNVCPTKNHDH